MPQKPKGLVERLNAGETIIMAEGYLFEFERRGYLQSGSFVPEVVLEHPNLVKSLYEEFVHCGSDVVLAFTYYGHRAKLEVVDRVLDLETLNRKALQMARQVVDETGTLMGGNICNTTIWSHTDPESKKKVREIFREQIEWAVEEGADFILGETFGYGEEAMAALECIKQYGKGLPAIINVIPMKSGKNYEGVPTEVMAKRLEDAGAAVVGLNCSFGPNTIVEEIKKIRKTCKIPISCLPVPFRTNSTYTSMQTIIDETTGKQAFPDNLTGCLCSRSDIEIFTRQMKENNVQVMGLCCGNMGSYIRTMAETLGREPPASKYSPDMSKHFSNMKDSAEAAKYHERVSVH